MKILYLSHYYLSERASSSYLVENRLEAFANAGFDVDLYVPFNKGANTKTERKNDKAEYKYNGKVCIHRFLTMAEKRNHYLRAFRYTFCCIKQLYLGIRANDFQLIFAPSTPPIQGAMAACLKKLKKRPFVYNLQDIFPDSLVGAGLAKKGGLLWRLGRMIENFTYRNADKIIVISEDFKQNIMAKGVPEEKIEVIYNWVDEKAVVNIPRSDNVLFERYGLDKNNFYITYNGNIGLTQNLDMLIEVAKDLEVYEDIHFILVGEGVYKKKLEKLIKEQGIKNVTLLPFQPYEEISHVFSLGDVSLVISKSGVGANSVPSKTWSIMSASRPVLASFDENELKTIIENNRCGIFTKAGDREAFTDAIIKLYNDRALCQEYGINGRKYIMENLTREIGTQKYVDIIKSFEKKLNK